MHKDSIVLLIFFRELPQNIFSSWYSNYIDFLRGKNRSITTHTLGILNFWHCSRIELPENEWVVIHLQQPLSSPKVFFLSSYMHSTPEMLYCFSGEVVVVGRHTHICIVIYGGCVWKCGAHIDYFRRNCVFSLMEEATLRKAIQTQRCHYVVLFNTHNVK